VPPKGDEPIALTLTEDERYLLANALMDWGGPLTCTEALAKAMGFDGVEDLEDEGYRIGNAIDRSEPLTLRDWTRACIATQIAFVLHPEWGSQHGGSDGKWITVLRGRPRKVPMSMEYLPG
jgi:hypothetical protein